MSQQQKPISAVSTLTGFADQSHFTKSFRRLTGVTPAVWLRFRWHPPIEPRFPRPDSKAYRNFRRTDACRSLRCRSERGGLEAVRAAPRLHQLQTQVPKADGLFPFVRLNSHNTEKYPMSETFVQRITKLYLHDGRKQSSPPVIAAGLTWLFVSWDNCYALRTSVVRQLEDDRRYGFGNRSILLDREYVKYIALAFGDGGASAR
jgi:AraC-like DNA-binding protein